MKKLWMIALLLSFSSFGQSKAIENAKWQTTKTIMYDASYAQLDYPNGDISIEKGVCIDVIIRAFRDEGKDLQKLIHEDISNNKYAYGISTIDKNIDHRRCKNVMTYFERKQKTLPISKKGSDYKPGDIVFWGIAYGHVGIVTDVKVPGTNRYYMIHNICCGAEMEDFLFEADIIQHVRWK
jgi:uncharacterized protein YijF (DUF1287 family)